MLIPVLLNHLSKTSTSKKATPETPASVVFSPPSMRNLSEIQKKPKRTRSGLNRDRVRGVANRHWGLCRKSNALFRLYDVEVAMVLKFPNGDVGGYQTQPGLVQELFRTSEEYLLGPPDLEAFKDVRAMPSGWLARPLDRRPLGRGPSLSSETSCSQDFEIMNSTAGEASPTSSRNMELTRPDHPVAHAPSISSTQNGSEAIPMDPAPIEHNYEDGSVTEQSVSSSEPDYSGLETLLAAIAETEGAVHEFEVEPAKQNKGKVISFLEKLWGF